MAHDKNEDADSPCNYWLHPDEPGHPAYVAPADEPNESVSVFEGEVQTIDGWPLVKLTGDDEPRMLDLDVARKAEHVRPTNIRQVIKDHRAELEEFGRLEVRTQPVQTQGGRPGTAFFLTESQAHHLFALLNTPKASSARVLMTKVFMAWRKGTLPAAPTSAMPVDDAEYFRRMAAMADRQKVLQADNEAIRAKQAEQDAATRAAQKAADEAAAKAEQETKAREAAIAQERQEREAAIATTAATIPEAVKSVVAAAESRIQENLVSRWTERKPPKAKPAPEGQIHMALPQTIRDMPEASGVIKRKLYAIAESTSERIMKDHPNAKADLVAGFVRCWLHAGIRHEASCALKFPLAGAIVNMPAMAFNALLAALDNKALIESVLAKAVAYPPEKIPASYGSTRGQQKGR